MELTKEQERIKGNIWKFAIFSITNKRTYLTFLTIFLLTFSNTTAKTIGLLTLVGQIAGFVFEIPSGYISDKIGHSRALIIEKVAFLLSTCCYLFATSIGWFFAGGILTAIGWAFGSGSANAFMHGTLQTLNKDHLFAKIMGRIKSLGFAVPIVFIILLPILAESSFRLAFLIAVIIDIVGLIFTLTLKEPWSAGVKTKEIKPGNFKSAFKEYKICGWFKYVFFGVLLSSLYMGSVTGFKNPFQESLGFSLTILGVFWATSRVLISLALLTNGWVYRTFSHKNFILLRGLIYGASFFVIGLSGNKWVIAIALVIATANIWGFTGASTQYRLEFIRDSRNKATLLSLNAFIKRVLTALFGYITGLTIFAVSYQKTYLFVAFAFVAVIILTYALLPKQKTNCLPT